MSFDLSNKLCLVAGASQGMGRVTAIEAAKAGATVLIAARRLEVCRQVAQEIRDSGGDAHAFSFEATDPESVATLLAAIEERWGKLDLAFNNVGKQQGAAPLHDIPLDRWDRAIGVNLSSVFYLMKHEIPLLRAAGGGSIVNNSSAAGLRGVRAMADYSAVKWGLIGLTKSAALDYASENIRVNIIAPGIIQTEAFESFRDNNPELMKTITARMPTERFGVMTEIAGVVLWLFSDHASYVNGAVIPVDGGDTSQ